MQIKTILANRFDAKQLMNILDKFKDQDLQKARTEQRKHTICIKWFRHKIKS